MTTRTVPGVLDSLADRGELSRCARAVDNRKRVRVECHEYRGDVFASGLENGSGNQLLVAQVEAVENSDGQHAPAGPGGLGGDRVSRAVEPVRPGRGGGGHHAAFPFPFCRSPGPGTPGAGGVLLWFRTAAPRNRGCDSGTMVLGCRILSG